MSSQAIIKDTSGGGSLTLNNNGGEVGPVINPTNTLTLTSSTPVTATSNDASVAARITGGTLVLAAGTNTFNISTTVSFMVSACGVKVAKHGNRSVSSACGSADVIEKLGINLDITPETVERCIAEIGIGFLFAPGLHGAMKHAIGPRREIGIRTIFNILGPLTNPAGADCQVMGVYRADLVEKLAGVLHENFLN